MPYYRRRTPAIQPYRPSQQGGNLYYVRLQTPVGVLYKFGFTTAASVQERFARWSATDAAYIDEVLVFLHVDNAADLEAAFHRHFGSKRAFADFSNDPQLPLYGNGQSELYVRDVLGLDPRFTEDQYRETMVAIAIKAHGLVPTEPTVEQRKEWDESRRRQEDVEAILKSREVSWLLRLYDKVTRLLSSSQEQKADAHLVASLRTRIEEAENERDKDRLRRTEERIKIRARLAQMEREHGIRGDS